MKSTDAQGLVVGFAVVVGATVEPVVTGDAGLVVDGVTVVVTPGAVVAGPGGTVPNRVVVVLGGTVPNRVVVVVVVVLAALELEHPAKTATHANSPDATVLPR
jgi:carbonic anhydrase/acetyltransferase-like protein (isoleucine patch superfamily)